MSNFVLENGVGNADKARVDEGNRLHVHSLSAGSSSVAAAAGDSFNVSSELITLTNGGESGILYIKNNEKDLVSVTTVFANLDTSENGIGKSLISFYLDADAGTLISEESEAQVLNRRVGFFGTLAVDAFKGGEGKTITSNSVIRLPSSGGAIASEFILSKGASFGLSITPPTGNTSMRIQIGFLVIRNYQVYTTD